MRSGSAALTGPSPSHGHPLAVCSAADDSRLAWAAAGARDQMSFLPNEVESGCEQLVAQGCV